MKILKKQVTCGEKKFAVSVDRNIAVAALEQFPELLDLIQVMSESGEKGKISLAEAAKKKQLGALFGLQEQTMKVVEFAFPLMLEKAGEESPEEKAKEIFSYAEENEVDDLLRDGMFGFLMEAFSLGERARKHKVTFAMK